MTCTRLLACLASLALAACLDHADTAGKPAIGSGSGSDTEPEIDPEPWMPDAAAPIDAAPDANAADADDQDADEAADEPDADEPDAEEPDAAPDAAPPELPPVCPAGPSQIQSPAILTPGPGAIMTAPAETCNPAGSDWRACNQHLHCPPEHTGGGTCANADCEIHTVYRKPKAGGVAPAVANLHGDLGTDCQPATHDLMVQGQFIKYGAGDTGTASNITYCGSATGNAQTDLNGDGRVTCAESLVDQTSVRWCIETACIRDIANQAAAEAIYGHDKPTRDQGCPGPIPACRQQGETCSANYDPTWATPNHCCAAAPSCVVPIGATTGTCQPSPPPPPPLPQCVAPGGACLYNWNPVSYSRDHCCSGAPDCVYAWAGATSGTCRPRVFPTPHPPMHSTMPH